MAFAVLFLEGAVSVWLSFRSLQEDAAHDAVGLGRLAAGLMQPALAVGDFPLALRRLSDAQNEDEESARFGWQWMGDAPWLTVYQRAALERGAPVTIQHRQGSRTHVLALVPVRVGSRLGVVQVDDDVTLQVTHVVRIGGVVLALIGLLATAFVVVGDRLGHRIVGVPVQRLIALSHSVGAGDLTGRVDATANDELGSLGRALNQMVELLQRSQVVLEAETRARLDAGERMRHADRLVTVGRLSAGIAHELGTPLNIVLLRAQLIRALNEEASQKHAAVIEAQVASMERIVKQLLGFARKSPSVPTEVELGAALRSVSELLKPAAQARKGRIELSLGQAANALVDRQALEQVLSNLVMNALQAIPQGSAVTLSCGEVTRSRQPTEPPRRWNFVAVADSGPGLPPQVRERLFEPFVTTKPVGSGTGLGLSVAWGLVQEWGGWIEVSPPEAGGCTFTCFLPTA